MTVESHPEDENQPAEFGIDLHLLSSGSEMPSHTLKESGTTVATVTYQICESFQAIQKFHTFEAGPSFSEYLQGAGIKEEYPIAFLASLHVNKERRNQGLGTRILQELEAILVQKKCFLMIGRAAWPEGDPEKNTHFYKSCGWIWPELGEFTAPIILKKLSATFQDQPMSELERAEQGAVKRGQRAL